MIRIHSVFLINKMQPNVSNEMTNGLFAKTLIALAEDPVPNIRFNVSKSVNQHWKYWGKDS